MKKRASQWAATAVALLIGALIGFGCSESAKQGDNEASGNPVALPKQPPAETTPKRVQRFGSVIGLKPEKKDYYIELHANTWPSVLDRIKKSNIRNYSIYLAELEGKLYLFSYFEYIGDDFEADMAKIAADPETQRWWKETDPCQIRLPGTPDDEQWLSIPEVFHTD